MHATRSDVRSSMVKMTGPMIRPALLNTSPTAVAVPRQCGRFTFSSSALSAGPGMLRRTPSVERRRAWRKKDQAGETPSVTVEEKSSESSGMETRYPMAMATGTKARLKRYITRQSTPEMALPSAAPTPKKMKREEA